MWDENHHSKSIWIKIYKYAKLILRLNIFMLFQAMMNWLTYGWNMNWILNIRQQLCALYYNLLRSRWWQGLSKMCLKLKISMPSLFTQQWRSEYENCCCACVDAIQSIGNESLISTRHQQWSIKDKTEELLNLVTSSTTSKFARHMFSLSLWIFHLNSYITTAGHKRDFSYFGHELRSLCT